jgi:predicted metalloprotease with PDZ domain
MTFLISLVAFSCCLPNLTTCHAAAPPGALGMNVRVENGWLTITAVHDNFPASREGLRAGDRITKIDGQRTQNKSLDDFRFGRSDRNYFYNPCANRLIRVERYVAGQVLRTLSLDEWRAMSGYDRTSKDIRVLP